MQAVGDVDGMGAVGGRCRVGDPVGQGDGGDCEGGGEKEGPEGDAVDDATHVFLEGSVAAGCATVGGGGEEEGGRRRMGAGAVKITYTR